MPQKKSGKQRLHGCAFRDKDSSKCTRQATKRGDAGSWLCPRHMTLARGECSSRRGRKTAPAVSQRKAMCSHNDPVPCPQRWQVKVEGVKYCKRHATLTRGDTQRKVIKTKPPRTTQTPKTRATDVVAPRQAKSENSCAGAKAPSSAANPATAKSTRAVSDDTVSSMDTAPSNTKTSR